MSTTKFYYKILEEEKVLIDGTRVPRREIVVDLKTYNTLSATSRRSETVYEYEERLNEDKKNIKILNRTHLNQLVKEVKSVLA